MRIPTIQGVIDRRILANFRVDSGVLRRLLPPPFRPKLVKGAGVAGICLIRLTHIRPRFMPSFIGITSENAAHRIAVEWEWLVFGFGGGRGVVWLRCSWGRGPELFGLRRGPGRISFVPCRRELGWCGRRRSRGFSERLGVR